MRHWLILYIVNTQHSWLLSHKEVTLASVVHKTTTCKPWGIDHNIKNIQKFLGLANYYRQFIKYSAFIARLLHDLVKKNRSGNGDWNREFLELIQSLEKWFTTKSILIVLDLDKKMRMEVNASDYATDEVLSMECKDGLWRLVAFLSKSLNETERNYEIYNKEILAIIRGL